MRKYIIYAFVMCTVTTACVQNKTEQTKQVTEINLEPEISTTPNTLSTQEIDEGWKLLWDGKTTEGWRGARLSEFPNNGWTIEDGLLKVQKSDGGESTNGGDIVTTRKYRNFILKVISKLQRVLIAALSILLIPILIKGKVQRSVVNIRYWMMRNIRMLNWVPTAIVL